MFKWLAYLLKSAVRPQCPGCQTEIRRPFYTITTPFYTVTPDLATITKKSASKALRGSPNPAPFSGNPQ